MTIENGTKMAIERYRDLLYSKGITNPINLSEIKQFNELSRRDQQCHALWMCEHLLSKEAKDFSIDKKSRWLGFIQALLILHGLTSIKNERNITRPWLTGAQNDSK